MHLQIESKFGKQLIIAKEERGQRDYVHFVIMKNWTRENKIPSKISSWTIFRTKKYPWPWTISIKINIATTFQIRKICYFVTGFILSDIIMPILIYFAITHTLQLFFPLENCVFEMLNV